VSAVRAFAEIGATVIFAFRPWTELHMENYRVSNNFAHQTEQLASQKLQEVRATRECR